MNLRFVFGFVVFLTWAGMSSGQETTGSLSGRILQLDGTPVPFANIVLKDSETNGMLVGSSQDNGSFRFLNVTPSTYSLEVSYLGYETHLDRGLMVRLGEETVHEVLMMESGLSLEQVTVLGQRAVSASENYISRQQISQTPAIFRSIQELQRSNPENNLNSFQGASHRFNNLNIDGVATNDIIGFQEPASGAAGSQANGTPGSLSKTQPIGFGAIKELSTKTTPFDVSIGNFNGANIDIITKNGTNRFENSVFGFFNNRLTSGKKLDGTDVDVPNFSDYQVGLNSGGPIIKDKLFYFANAEFARSLTPLLNSPGSDATNISTEDVVLVRNHLIENYDYDPGAFETASNEIKSSKVFLRLDYPVSYTHLTLPTICSV